MVAGPVPTHRRQCPPSARPTLDPFQDHWPLPVKQVLPLSGWHRQLTDLAQATDRLRQPLAGVLEADRDVMDASSERHDTRCAGGLGGWLMSSVPVRDKLRPKRPSARRDFRRASDALDTACLVQVYTVRMAASLGLDRRGSRHERRVERVERRILHLPQPRLPRRTPSTGLTSTPTPILVAASCLHPPSDFPTPGQGCQGWPGMAAVRTNSSSQTPPSLHEAPSMGSWSVDKVTGSTGSSPPVLGLHVWTSHDAES